jgi:hypothetical protein
MSVMPNALKERVDNDWLPAVATITACEQALLGQENFSEEGYIPPEYRVSFSYAVDGRVFEGATERPSRRSADTASRFFTTPIIQARIPVRTCWTIDGSSGQRKLLELGRRC